MRHPFGTKWAGLMGLMNQVGMEGRGGLLGMEGMVDLGARGGHRVRLEAGLKQLRGAHAHGAFVQQGPARWTPQHR
jgi:hypothetical protein